MNFEEQLGFDITDSFNRKSSASYTSHVYLTACDNNNPHTFRPTQRAKVTGLVRAKPSCNLPPRLCLTLEYPDGIIDQVPVSEVVEFGGDVYKLI